jgi:peptidoglycan/xylan/chitin deacetylase (PgdA/CDA1 family)
MIEAFKNRLVQLFWEKGFLGRPKSLRVLTYHGVIESYQDPFLERNFLTRENFNIQLDYITKYFKVISIKEMIEFEDQFSNEVVITFDDGYLNNLIAIEILEERKLPYAIFLTTGLIDSLDSSIWTVNLSLLLLKGSLDRIFLMNRYWDLGNSIEKRASFNQIRHKLKKMKTIEKNKILIELYNQYPSNELELLLEHFPSFKMLTHNHVKRLDSYSLCTLGSHGFNHELLHEYQDLSSIRHEVSESVGYFLDFLENSPKYYAYPNGDSCIEAEKILAELGFECSFENRPKRVLKLKSNFGIPRLNVPREIKVFKSQINRFSI